MEQLNRATHEDEWDTARVEWSLANDVARFHVFVVARAPSLGLAVRIDWRDSGRLEVEPYAAQEPGSEEVLIGRGYGFCRECIVHAVAECVESYQLFTCNCRTVAFMVLTRVCGFDPDAVYERFDQRDMRCGLGNPGDCFSLEEMQHYLAWQRKEDAKKKAVAAAATATAATEAAKRLNK